MFSINSGESFLIWEIQESINKETWTIWFNPSFLSQKGKFCKSLEQFFPKSRRYLGKSSIQLYRIQGIHSCNNKRKQNMTDTCNMCIYRSCGNLCADCTLVILDLGMQANCGDTHLLDVNKLLAKLIITCFGCWLWLQLFFEFGVCKPDGLEVTNFWRIANIYFLIFLIFWSF